MTDPTPPRGSRPTLPRLKAPRFNNDPVLERCAAGTHRMFVGQTGPAVRLVQQALIDLGHDLGPRADDGVFGGLTSQAVASFKTKRGIFPNDPVVGPKTMTALDAEMIDKPPAPLSDRDEWLSWGRRDQIARVSPFNFTRFDEFSRRKAGRSFRLDPISSWMPSAFATVFLDHLSALLEPRGSPDGPGTGAATWGLCPVDLFHCHVSLGVPSGADPVLLQGRGPALTGRLEKLMKDADLASGGANRYNDSWSAAHARLLNTVGVKSVLPTAAELINDITSVATTAKPGLLVWHSFEREGWRPHISPGVEMPSGHPRRHWVSSFAPTPKRPTRAPFITHAENLAAVHMYFSVNFVVDKSGLVTALPGSFIEVASVTGIGYDFVP